MLIVKNKKAVVFKMRKPERITTVIPTAVTIPKSDHTVVAVPHRPDETRVLRNLGYDVPDPMPIHYDWPKANGRFDPFEAQRTTASFLTMNSRAYCLNSMGTGKTNAALWAYDYMRKLKQVKRMLVICPLSTMERTWGDGIFSTFPHLDFAVLYGTRDRRLRLLKSDADIYIINIDGVRTIEKELAARTDIDLIVVDELAMARNASTERWKTLNAICNKQGSRRVWGMTGSPTPNSPTDAWAQCRLITPDSDQVPRYFGRFRDGVMRQLTQFKWVPRPDANDTIHKMMQPAIRFSLDDCTDLPEQTFITREVEMTPAQKKAYKDMVSKLSVELAGGQILAINEAVKANKLVQIACIAYDTEVLTDKGWVPIQDVRDDHKVWDGLEWVSQGGSVYKGAKSLVEIDGVRMTSDHKVWLGEWVTAQEIIDGHACGGFSRSSVRLPDGIEASDREYGKNKDSTLGVQVRLWGYSGSAEPVSTKPETRVRSQLWVSPRQRVTQDVEHAAPSNVDSVAASVYGPQRQGLQELWRSWNLRLRSVGRVVRELLGGHAGWLPRQLNPRPRQRARPVLSRELQMGDSTRASEQQARERASGNSQGGYDCGTSSASLRDQTRDAAGTTEQIQVATDTGFDRTYDLLNCGPRNRFVVRGTSGCALIVHNCGVAYDTLGNTIVIDNKPRIDAVKEIIEESEGKVIVFIPLTGALEYVAKELRAMYEDPEEVAVVHGETSKTERDEIFRAFQQTQSPRVLVANAQTMSHGLTLTAATTIIWYAPVHSNEIYSQANARVRRPGQTRTTVIAHIAGTDIERKVYKRLQEKESMQGILLEMMKELENA